MTNLGFINREVLLCILLCLSVTLVEAVNSNEVKTINRKIDIMIGGLQSQIITAMLEIEELRNKPDNCTCEHQTTTENVDSQLGLTQSNENKVNDTQTTEALVERIFNGFMDEKYARKQLEHQIRIHIHKTITSQNKENNRLQNILTDMNDTITVQHIKIKRLDTVNKNNNIKTEKLKSTVEEISNTMKSDRDEINGLIELVFDLNNTVITQHDEIQRLDKEMSMFNTKAKSTNEEIVSLNKTLRVMTSTIDWMTASIPICTKPESINYGNVEYSATVMGSVVTYTCNEGYSLQGLNESKCLQNKQWEGAPPVCTPEKCFLHVKNDSYYWFLFQKDDSFGLITKNRYIHHGLDVFIECKDGYVLTNAQYQTATTIQNTHCYFGTWNNANNCRPKSCPLPVFNNGIIKTKTGYIVNEFATDSTKITFECKSEYRLELLNSEDSVVQSLEATCRLGQWSLETPKCLPSKKESTEAENKYMPYDLSSYINVNSGKNESTEAENMDMVYDFSGTINVGRGVDAYILVDISSSISAAKYKDMMNFIKQLLPYLQIGSRPTDTRLALYYFASDVHEIFDCHMEHHNIDDENCWNYTEAQSKIDKVDRNIYANNTNNTDRDTDLAAALQTIRIHLETKMFSLSVPSRNEVQQVIILLSDGHHKLGGDPMEIANYLKSALYNIEIFSIAVGKDDKGLKKMKNIASYIENEKHFFVINTGHVDLKKVIAQMISD